MSDTQPTQPPAVCRQSGKLILRGIDGTTSHEFSFEAQGPDQQTCSALFLDAIKQLSTITINERLVPAEPNPLT